MRLEPIRDRIVITPEDKAQYSNGKHGKRILLPDMSQKRPWRGTVVSIGPEVKIDVKEGDMIFYGPFTGTDYEMEGETFIILGENEVLGKVIP